MLFPIFMGIIWLVFFALGILGVIFWIFMLIDAVKKKYKNENDKIIWILVIVLVGVLGAIIYYFVEKDK
jgi:4-amino-4-deoxy-L-arabinose transferase-like glycosyltransferase